MGRSTFRKCACIADISTYSIVLCLRWHVSDWSIVPFFTKLLLPSRAIHSLCLRQRTLRHHGSFLCNVYAGARDGSRGVPSYFLYKARGNWEVCYCFDLSWNLKKTRLFSNYIVDVVFWVYTGKMYFLLLCICESLRNAHGKNDT